MPTSSKARPTLLKKWRQRLKLFLDRRPHRSFRLSRRRDYEHPIVLPGLIALTHTVNKTLWKYKRIFIPLALIYIALYLVLVGALSQDTYSSLSDAMQQTSDEVASGDIGAVTQAGILFLTIASSGGGSTTTETQQIFSVILILMVWLTTVWLLRNLMAGHKVKLRDGLYNSGAPIFSTFLVVLLIAVQLLPIAIAAIGYSAATASGLLAGGVEAMLFWVAAALLALLSLYWITSSVLALIIVTLPGMYPYQAIKTAGDLILGRRVKILIRWIWMGLVLLVAWVVVIIPIILFDMWVKSLWPAIEWLPIVPLTVVAMGAVSAVWVSTYAYTVYRKVVDYVPATK
jgi:hypothetical protein